MPGGVSHFGLGGTHGSLIFKPTFESDIVAPAQMIALGDYFSRSTRADGAAEITGEIALIGPSLGFWGGPADALPPKRQPPFLNHHGRANRAYVDGHIAPEDMRRPFKPTDEDLSQWNSDHKPHRDFFGI
jgi:prepilin-type processing-associated H-X9-DG protein